MNRLGFHARLAIALAVALIAPVTGTPPRTPIRCSCSTARSPPDLPGRRRANACVSIVNEALVDVATGCIDAAGHYGPRGVATRGKPAEP
jgi:hypothetical protein